MNDNTEKFNPNNMSVQDKVILVNELAKKNQQFFIHVNTKQNGSNLSIPFPLMKNEHVLFQFASDIVMEFKANAEGISAVLLFNVNPFKVFIPWNCIFSIVDALGRGFVWENLAPQSIIDEINKNKLEAKEEKRIGKIVYRSVYKNKFGEKKTLPDYMKIVEVV